MFFILVLLKLIAMLSSTSDGSSCNGHVRGTSKVFAPARIKASAILSRFLYCIAYVNRFEVLCEVMGKLLPNRQRDITSATRNGSFRLKADKYFKLKSEIRLQCVDSTRRAKSSKVIACFCIKSCSKRYLIFLRTSCRLLCRFITNGVNKWDSNKQKTPSYRKPVILLVSHIVRHSMTIASLSFICHHCRIKHIFDRNKQLMTTTTAKN